MKILWVCNAPTSELSNFLNIKYVSGSWIESALNPLKKLEKDVVFLWATAGTQTLEKVEISGNTYFLMPSGSTLKEYYSLFEELFEKEKFDLVHIWGTESLYSLACLEICNKNNIKNVISIQGLIRNCSISYDIKIPEYVKTRSTIYELVRGNTFKNQMDRFYKNGLNEKTIIKNAKHVIGRTQWDKENVFLINSQIKYHHCDENLRNDFYLSNKWSYESCEKNTIFVSQASYSLKGFHILLHALYFVKKELKDIKIYIAGYNIFENKGIKTKITQGTYKKYLIHLIKKYDLEDNLVFLGPLNSKKMNEYYLKCNIFCSCSLMENSSNSISEAMILGVPIISSYVGGIPTLADNRKELLFYSSYDYYHLAALILELLKNQELSKYLSKNSITTAEERHSILKNTNKLISIYNNILSGD